MITWHSINPEEMIGRDAVINTPDGLVRGPISQFIIKDDHITISFFWTALKRYPEGPWELGLARTLGFFRNEPVTLPILDPGGRIRFRFNVDGFKDAEILPVGENLDPYKVAGLACELDTTQGEF